MKKSIIMFISLVAVVSASYAQYRVDTGDSSVVVTGKDGQQIVNITGEPQRDRISVEVLGMKLQLRSNDADGAPQSPVISKPRVDRGHLAFLELGYTYTFNLDYFYLDMIGAENYGFMEYKNWKSLEIAGALTKVSFDLDRAGNSSLTLGIQGIFSFLMLPKDIRLEKRDGMVIPVKVDDPYKSSYLATYSFRFPIMFEMNAEYDLFISWGAYIDIVTGSSAVTRKPNTEIANPYLNPVQVGVSMRMGWRNYYVYVNGSVTNRFKDGRGPMYNYTTVGVGLDF